jgi:putative hydrolase of the HAD superfamily
MMQKGFTTAEAEEDMVPHAMLLDLDETLIDRTQSIAQYATRFHGDFADHLAPIAVPTIAATILTADERGYRPRTALFADLLQQLPWHLPPEIARLQTHWEAWFPAASVARVGLYETLTSLHAQGIRLGIVTNDVVRRQQPKIERLRIRPYLSTVVISEAVQVKKPDPRIFARALAEVGCTASQAWFVGDHPVNDVLGAAAAGCRPIWLRGVHPWPLDYPVPTWQIGALPELVALVQQERSLAT